MTEKIAAAIQREEEGIHARILHDNYQHFLEKWAPEDRRELAEFNADLMMLVRIIHQDAARPFGKMLENAMAAMPLAPFIVKKPEDL